MKRRYKKIAVLTTMFVMGVNLLTFSLKNDKKKINENEKNAVETGRNIESSNTQDVNNMPQVALNRTALDINQDSNDMLLRNFEIDLQQMAYSDDTTPEPTSFPVEDLKKDAIPEVNTLISEYYVAKINCDTNKLKSLLSDASAVKKKEILESETEYIEDVRNIVVYTKPSIYENTYIAYVYHEIKFTGVNTLAPGLSKFYIVNGDDGQYKVFSGDIDEEVALFNMERNQDEDVVKLINESKKKVKKAKEKDQDLAEFWSNIDELSQKAEQENN